MKYFDHPFMKHLRHECKRYDINLVFHNSSEIVYDDGSPSEGGYFTDNPLEIGIACKVDKQDFFTCLVHEFSHFEQWRDESPYWHRKYNGVIAQNMVHNWLLGHHYKKKDIEKAIDIVKECELDCERRTIVNLKKYDMGVNTKKYAQNASAYIHFHNFIKKTRKWDYPINPNDVPRILDLMPTNLDGDYKETPNEIMVLYHKYFR